MEPYTPRTIGFHGFRGIRGWQLKLYSILYGPGPLDWTGLEPGLQLAELELPEPAQSPGRPGLGFLIAHQGRTGDYVVLGWWAHENELPLRVFVRRDRAAGWRAACQDESICVWDLEVIWAERQAWVATMLARTGPDRASYLTRICEAAAQRSRTT